MFIIPLIIGVIALDMVIIVVATSIGTKVKKVKRPTPTPILTIKSIIRWEQLMERSFSSIDFKKEEDIAAILYTSSNIDVTFEAFRIALSKGKFAIDMIKSFEKDAKIMAQYQKKTESENNSTSSETIGSIISILIMSGLDAEYAMGMRICDLPMFIDAYERMKKEKMEGDRLWTYLSILPHIDAKKLKNGAKDLVTFPWETEIQKQEAERSIKEDSAKFEEFMIKGKSIIK